MDMRALFPGHFWPTEEDYKTAWDNALFVFDANILLNFYRYSESTAADFFLIFRKLRGRIWIPHRVAEEYFANRASVVSEQAQEYIGAAKKLDELREKLDNTQSHPFISPSLDEELKEVSRKLKEELDSGKERHEKRIHDDDVLRSLYDLIGSAIGEVSEEAELDAIIEEGERRYSEQIPPGYMDAKKVDSQAPKLALLRRFGDLIVWKQMIKHSKATRKDMILVTNDNKEDWWSIKSGKTIGLRPELVSEFVKETDGCNVYGYQVARFMDEAKDYLRISVSDETVREIRSLKARDAAWRRKRSVSAKKERDAEYQSILDEYHKAKHEAAALGEQLAYLKAEYKKEESQRYLMDLDDVDTERLEDEKLRREFFENEFSDLREKYQAALDRMKRASVLADFMRDKSSRIEVARPDE